LIDWARRNSQGLDTFKPKYAIADILITKYYLIEFNYVISKEFFSKKKNSKILLKLLYLILIE
jgi:hypothetical protein